MVVGSLSLVHCSSVRANILRFFPPPLFFIKHNSDRSSNNANPSTMRGKLLLGCVELQPRTPFAFLEVFVRSDVAETPLEYSGPPEVTIERTEHSISDPAGWTKFTYKIAVRNREVGFKETDIQFVHAQSGQSQERCVSYGQKHEHQWYCAVQDSSKSGSSPEVTRYKRNYCQQCPSTMGKRSDGAEDTRVRLLRCCVPNSGDVCEVEEVTKSYFCKGSPKPPTGKRRLLVVGRWLLVVVDTSACNFSRFVRFLSFLCPCCFPCFCLILHDA